MDAHQKVLFVDAATGYYRVTRFPVGDFFGPVDLGLHLAGRHNSLNIGVGLLAGSIFPGSNRLIFTGFSPCWGGFFVSSMGGAGLVFDNLGINMVSLVGRAPTPSLLYLNRTHGEEIDVKLVPVDLPRVWARRPGWHLRPDGSRRRAVSAVATRPTRASWPSGPAAAATDFGAIGSVPIVARQALPRRHLGRPRRPRQQDAPAARHRRRHLRRDVRRRGLPRPQGRRPVVPGQVPEEAQRQGPRGHRQVPLRPEVRHRRHVRRQLRHHRRTPAGLQLHQHLHERGRAERDSREVHPRSLPAASSTRRPSRPSSSTPAASRARPSARRCGTSSRRTTSPTRPWDRSAASSTSAAAERLNHHADMYGFDAISVGGVLSWLMECLAKGLLDHGRAGRDAPARVLAPGLQPRDRFAEQRRAGRRAPRRHRRQARRPRPGGGRPEARPATGAREGQGGPRPLRLHRRTPARAGWCRTSTGRPGALSPMAIMGKYYMYYGAEFMPPRKLGRINAQRFRDELIMDNLGMCRFHRLWAEEMLPEVDRLPVRPERPVPEGPRRSRPAASTAGTPRSSGNPSGLPTTCTPSSSGSAMWTAIRTRSSPSGSAASRRTSRKRRSSFWYEVHKGIHESLREF